MEKLDPRLALIYRMVPPCRLAADVGTDHGYLICALVESGKARRGIAADIAPLPLEKARREAERRILGINRAAVYSADIIIQHFDEKHKAHSARKSIFPQIPARGKKHLQFCWPCVILQII